MQIIIIDDHALFLQGITTLIAQHLPDAKIETFNNVESAYQFVLTHSDADIILADIFMPKYNGLTIMELLNKEHLLIPILLVSATDDYRLVKQYLDLNASGFIHKSKEPKLLLEAIKQVTEKGSFLDSQTSEVIAQIKRINISDRQQDVLALLSEGLPNKEIGEKLGISEITVKSHISALFDFFGARNRLDCIRKAEKLNMVSLANESN